MTTSYMELSGVKFCSFKGDLFSAMLVESVKKAYVSSRLEDDERIKRSYYSNKMERHLKEKRYSQGSSLSPNWPPKRDGAAL